VEKDLSLQRGKTNKLEGNKKVVDMVKLANLKFNNKDTKIANLLEKLKDKKKKVLDGGS
jgi:hypothetical protein